MEERVRVARLVHVLRSYRFRYTTEKEMHAAVRRALSENAVPFTDECDLGDCGVVDFLVGDGVALELKMQGSPTDVARQLLGYSRSDRVRELVLLTGRHRLGNLPRKLSGKPLHVVSLWASVF